MLTETTVKASDKRAFFVGIDAYEAAGGRVLHDLFEEDEGGWLQDVGLLDRLVAEKLQAAADAISSEGWKWVEVATSFPYGHDHGLRTLSGAMIDLTDEERATREGLRSELDRLEAEYAQADELPDDVDLRLSEIETALEAFENRLVRYDPAGIAIAGAFASIAADGSLSVDRGYVRPEDEPCVENTGDAGDIAESEDAPSDDSADNHACAVSGMPETDEESDVKPLPDRLVTELSAYRTLALQNVVADNPHIALTALLHKLVSDAFGHQPAAGALEVSIRHTVFSSQCDGLQDSPSAQSIASRHDRWEERIPTDDEALWNWLSTLDDDNRLALLAHCTSFGVNALQERPHPYGGSGVSEHGLKVRHVQANRLTRETGLDMVQCGWRPTVSNYLGRVPKARILQAVREGAGERSAQLLDHMKKEDMAREAERLLTNSGWLPELLRTPHSEEPVDPVASGDAIAETAAIENETVVGEEDDSTDTEEAEDAISAIAAE